jgi:proteasome lid subunit RPN8/RPN11
MLILPEEHREAMIAHARAEFPAEACGLFAGEAVDGGKTVKAVYCLRNTDKSAEHFSMAPEEQFKAIKDMRGKGFALLGNFHSHPETPARPSEEDIRLAFDPSLSYIIISLAGADTGGGGNTSEPVVKSFCIKGGAAVEEPLKV